MYSEQPWGRFFWRRGGRGVDWQTAKNTCEQEGAALPVPRDHSQNMFFYLNACGPAFSTEPTGNGCYGLIWLGINDEETEGTYVDNEGIPITWSNWHPIHDVDNLDASFIYGTHWPGVHTKWQFGRTTEQYGNFMCIKFLDV